MKRRFFFGQIWLSFEPKKSPKDHSLGCSDKNYIRAIPVASSSNLAKGNRLRSCIRHMRVSWRQGTASASSACPPHADEVATLGN